MKPLFVVLLLCVLSFCPAARADETADERYVKIYSLIQRADQLQSKGRTTEATAKLTEAHKGLKQLRDDFPEWNPKLVKFRLEFLAAKLADAPKPAVGSSSAMIDGPAGPLEFKLKWVAGKRYVQRSEVTQNSEMSIPGQPQSQKIETAMGQDIAISALKEREGGGRDMELEFLALSINMKMAGMPAMSFDTKQSPDKDAGNPMAGGLRKLVGAKVKFVTDANGRVESVQGLDALVAGLSDPSAPAGADPVKGILSEDSIKKLTAGDAGLPDKAVKVGDSWPVRTESSLPELGGDVVVSLKCTFKGWAMHDNHKCAVLEFTGDITSKPGAKGAEGVALDNGKVSGTTWFDPALGVVVETVGNQDFNMKMAIQGQSISAKMHQATGNKLVQVAELSK